MTAELISDYKGFDLAIGSVQAVRWFTVDQWGRLRGRHYDHIWTPGENVAKCRASEGGGIRLVGNYFASNYTYLAPTVTFTTINGVPVPTSPPEPAKEPEKVECAVPNPDCTCGFYAFAEGRDDGNYRGEDAALGVIEVYGRTILGTKGLRGEKARVLAIRSGDKRLHANYPDVRFYTERNAMFSDYQLVAPFQRTPDSDPDFWTRA